MCQFVDSNMPHPLHTTKISKLSSVGRHIDYFYQYYNYNECELPTRTLGTYYNVVYIKNGWGYFYCFF